MTDRGSRRLEQLRAEANYHRQRLDLYQARLYGGRALSVTRLEEFQRASAAAAARLTGVVELSGPGTFELSADTSDPPPHDCA